jgi:hypothetical protein
MQKGSHLMCLEVMQVAQVPACERLTSKAQLLKRNIVGCIDFDFNYLVGTLDSPKILFDMVMDAFRPFLGQYYQA